MHWDYWTFREQPLDFIEDILQHMTAESDAYKANNKK